MKDALAVSESGSNGRPLFGGAFSYFSLEDGWSDGDRLVQCAVYDPLNSELVGSLRAAAR